MKDEIIWNGHLCECSDLSAAIGEDCWLWTLCGSDDLRAREATEGDIRDVECPDCLAIWNEENGQFGVGA